MNTLSVDKYASYRNLKLPEKKLCGDALITEQERSYNQLLSTKVLRPLTNGESKYLFELESQLLKKHIIGERHEGFRTTYKRIKSIIGNNFSENN